jgi:hypothetical protein
MHDIPVVETKGAGTSIPATTPPTSVKKKEATRWSRFTDLGRYKLASGCIVPTTYQQQQGGRTRTGEGKGKTGQARGQDVSGRDSDWMSCQRNLKGHDSGLVQRLVLWLARVAP